jgi:hypothetical protein
MTNIKIIDIPGDPFYAPGPKPPASLGSNLDTVEKARTWLTHPSNWFKSTLFIVKWDGYVPYINAKHARDLLANPSDDFMLRVIMTHQKMLKDRGQPEDESVWRGEE